MTIVENGLEWAATYATPAPAMKVFPVPHSPTILTAS